MEKPEDKHGRRYFGRSILEENLEDELPCNWSVVDEVEASFPQATPGEQRDLLEIMR